jgi:hypothetical protein
MRMAEQHMDLDEQRQADEWQEYLLWFEEERRSNEQQEQSSTQH